MSKSLNPIVLISTSRTKEQKAKTLTCLLDVEDLVNQMRSDELVYVVMRKASLGSYIMFIGSCVEHHQS